MPNPAQTDLWRAAAQGNWPDWDEAFAGYNATVDWPAAYFWRELSAHYPAAKILLTVRSAESWYDSMEKTICQVIKTSTDPNSLGVKLVGEGVFGGRIDDRAHAIAVYERNTTEVQAAVPPDRLLTYNLGDGWEPLCAFLDKPIPNRPYPRTNSSAEFAEMMAARTSNP